MYCRFYTSRNLGNFEVFFSMLLILLVLLAPGLQADPLKFKRIGTAQGLPQNTITTLFKSSDGRLWVGTQNGLSWFDGYQFHTFKSDNSDPHSISDNFIWSIAEDNNGYLWVGTRIGGLNRLDLSNNRFKSFTHNTDDPGSIGGNNVLSLLFDSQRRLWVGTSGGGLNLFDFEKESFKRFKNDPENPASIAGDHVKTIIEDNKGNLWLGLSTAPFINNKGAGLDYFTPKNNQFSHYRHDSNNVNTISSNEVSALYLDDDESLWVATYLGGLNHFDPKTGKTIRYELDESNPSSIPSIRTMAIAKADENGLWLGFARGALVYFDKKTKHFTQHTNEAARPTSLSGKDAVSLLKDGDKLWIGTWWNGLNKLNLSSQKFGWSRYEPAKSNSLPNNAISSFSEDNKGNVWIAARDSGLVKWNRSEDSFDYILKFPGNGEDWARHMIATVFVDSEQRLWVGTLRNGLYKLDWNKQIFKHYTTGNSSTKNIPHENVNSIIEYPKGTLWIGSRGGGIFRFDSQKEEFIHFKHDVDDPTSISSNTFSSNSIFLDSKKHIWFGSEDSGAVRINPKNNRVLRFSTTEKLTRISHNLISAISEDSLGNIWLASYGGGVDKVYHHQGKWRVENFNSKNAYLPSDALDTLVIDGDDNLWFATVGNISKFNARTELISNFNIYDGALPDEYFNGSQFIGKDENIYFGGTGGVSYFKPDNIISQIQKPNVFLTEFSLFNRPVNASEQPQAVLGKVISRTKHITLSHTQNVYSFDFTSLDYIDPSRNQYAYKMQGFNDQWIYTDATNRRATFTNLDAGNYTFEVIASNKDGVWSNEGEWVQLTILPAPWKTWWAYAIYVLLFSLTIAAFLRQKHKTLLATTKRRMAEDADAAKSNFLATMSHEIRTPINGVIGAVSLLSECHLNNEQSSYARTIKVSGENLLYIVNDILDLSKIESGNLSLEKHVFNLRSCIEHAMELFTSNLDQINSELIFIAEDAVPRQVYSDSTRLRQIIVNLVGNAIKFTENGSITILIEHVSSSNNHHRLKFRIKDTGEGIPEDKQQYIFDAFKQADETIARLHGGTGLGLTISQRLVSILGGSISIDSQEGVGTEFSFEITLEVPSEFSSINYLPHNSELASKEYVFIGCDKTQKLFFENFNQNIDNKFKYIENSPDTLGLIKSAKIPDVIVINLNSIEETIIFLAEQIKQDEQLRGVQLAVLTTPNIAHSNTTRLGALFDTQILKPLRFSSVHEHLLDLVGSSFQTKEKETSLLYLDFANDNPLNILLAEDNAVNQKILLHTFRKLGYNPDIVSNGYESIDALKQKKYDLLITDIQMPGMTGIQAMEIIRKVYNSSELLIAFFSADVTTNLEPLIQQDVVQEILSKPLSINALKRFLKKCSQRISVNSPT